MSNFTVSTGQMIINGDNKLEVLEFVFRSDECRSSMQFEFEGDPIPIEQWNDLADGKRVNIIINTINGNSSIKRDGQKVIFMYSHVGGSGSGKSVITIPFSSAQEVFQYIARLLDVTD